jgi:uncharacterized membrane protein YcjF (UPF0283 family)
MPNLAFLLPFKRAVHPDIGDFIKDLANDFVQYAV